jgi:hypothetical protein
MVMAGAGAAFAGEWNPGHFDDPGGNVPAKGNANSECLFNGLDEPDESAFEAGDGEEWFGPGLGGDDGLWGLTPAGGKVQSGGQMIAALKQGVDFGLPPEETPFPGVQKYACNGHTAGLK